MPKSGLSRYLELFKNVANPAEYLSNKVVRKKRPLTIVTKPNAVEFKVSPSLYLVFKEIFMVDVYNIDYLISLLPSSPTVIDIGANAGFFDILLLSKLKDSKIYAYEPVPSNVLYIESLLKENNWIRSQVKLFPKAVTGADSGGLELFMEDTADNQVVASVFNGFNVNNTKKIKVESITLTQIINDIGSKTIDLLKMDCEGSEYDIVYNTPKELFERITNLFIEVHDIDKEKNNIQYFDSYIKSMGYKTTYSPINDFCWAFEGVKS